MSKVCPKCKSNKKIGIEWLGTDRVCHWYCQECKYKYLRFSISETKRLIKIARRLEGKMGKTYDK